MLLLLLPLYHGVMEAYIFLRFAESLGPLVPMYYLRRAFAHKANMRKTRGNKGHGSFRTTAAAADAASVHLAWHVTWILYRTANHTNHTAKPHTINYAQMYLCVG